MSFLILFFLSITFTFGLGPLLEYEASEMTEALFSDLLLNGRVAIIRGGSSSWPLLNFTCEDFRKQPELREYEIERVYGENDGSYVRLCEDTSCDAWENDKRPSLNSESDGPQFAPLYWEVRKHKPAIEYIYSLTPDWPFMSVQNRWWKKNAVELWFSPPSAGAKSHIDGHVQATVVTQLVGTRRWRLALIPGNEVPTLIPNHLDSNKFPWTPDIVTTLNTGDVLIFPPGSIHDTLNVSPTSCAASITHQLGHPLPVKFFRNFLSNFLSTPDLRESWPIIADLASFGYLRPRLSVDGPFFLADQQLNYNETIPETFFSKIYDSFIMKSPTRGPYATRPLNEYIAYHDTNNDGVVDKTEFLSSSLTWLKLELSIITSFPRKFRVMRYFYTQIEDQDVSQSYWDELNAFQAQTAYKHVLSRDEL